MIAIFYNVGHVNNVSAFKKLDKLFYLYTFLGNVINLMEFDSPRWSADGVSQGSSILQGIPILMLSRSATLSEQFPLYLNYFYLSMFQRSWIIMKTIEARRAERSEGKYEKHYI